MHNCHSLVSFLECWSYRKNTLLLQSPTRRNLWQVINITSLSKQREITLCPWVLFFGVSISTSERKRKLHKGFDRLSFFNDLWKMTVSAKRWWKNSCSFPMIIDFKRGRCWTFLIFNDDLFFWKVWDFWNSALRVVRKKWIIVESKVF